VLDLGGAAALEGLLVAVLGVAEGVPEAERRLHAQLGLEGPERGVGVIGPVTPSRAGQAILEEHADDGHHGEATIGKLGVEALLPQLGITCSKKGRLPATIASSGRRRVGVVAEAARGLAEEAVGDNLEPSGARHLGDGREAIGDVLELESR